MSIWFKPVTIEELEARGKDTMVEVLGIELTEIGADYLAGRMPVDHRTKQPLGIMHGGASCVLAESLGSIAANYCVDLEHYYCVGLDINTNHIRSILEGFVKGIAKPFHLGTRTQVWGINITDAQDNLISVSRLTLAVLTREK